MLGRTIKMKQHDYSASEISQLKSKCQTVGDLVKAVEDEYQNKGYVICQFVINDMKLSESDEHRLQDINTVELEKIKIFYENPDHLLHEIINNWREEIPQIIIKTDQLATKINSDGFENNLVDFIQVIESCQMLVQSLISLHVVLTPMNLIEVPSWNINEQQLASAVGQALSAAESKNSDLLSEIIEYDLANSLQSWAELFDKISHELSKKNDSRF